MNPQYLQQQYGPPSGPGFGPPQSGYPSMPHGGPRPSPSGTPGEFQQPSGPPAPGAMQPLGLTGPQRMVPPPQGPPSPSSNMSAPGGPMHVGPGMMTGGPNPSSYRPVFSGSTMANGPSGPPTGMQSEFILQLVCVLDH
jgi:hypothetical protein